MFWIILIVIVIIIAIFFLKDLNKDNSDLNGQTLAEKFKTTIDIINQSAFGGRGIVIPTDKRALNLYEEGQNQIIQFIYSTGHLTIIWRYKYYHNEVIHEMTFRDMRNLNLIQQKEIAERMISEMKFVVQKHQAKIDSKQQ
jgi:hypothetical protein